MHLIHLHRPSLPRMRAQSLQVLHTCHALARRGHAVTCFAERGPGFTGGVAEALAPYGLSPHPCFDLEILGLRHPGLAGLAFRAGVARRLGARREPRPPVLFVRSWRHADQVRILRRFTRFHLVFEAHEVDSAQARERGAPFEAAARREARVLTALHGLVANCEGTLAVLEEIHGDRLPGARCVVHNGTDPSRACDPIPHPGVVAGYVGSPRAFKDVRCLLAAAEHLPEGFRVRLVGGDPQDGDFDALAAAASPRVEVRPGVACADVPGVLAGLDVLVLSLGDDLYARRLASPLKLWDYLATGLPVVAPDHPSVAAICPDGFHPYRPGDAASLARAIQAAAARGRGARRLRTWDDRAVELEAFLEALP
ncbi:MAG: glycosyltransferase family 4 protein [Deltaproteobacteria bacterium]|nr:glycosyltransferase family 4 protein [Deltaproteobacteria bacterium]